MLDVQFIRLCWDGGFPGARSYTCFLLFFEGPPSPPTPTAPRTRAPHPPPPRPPPTPPPRPPPLHRPPRSHTRATSAKLACDLHARSPPLTLEWYTVIDHIALPSYSHANLTLTAHIAHAPYDRHVLVGSLSLSVLGSTLSVSN